MRDEWKAEIKALICSDVSLVAFRDDLKAGASFDGMEAEISGSAKL